MIPAVAAVYARKSTEDERTPDDGKSTARQVEHGTTFAQDQLAAVVRAEWTYQDDGISGAEFVNRPGLQRLLADLKRTPVPFQSLVISEPSRLGREQVETAWVLKQITDAGVRVYSYLTGREIPMASATDKLVASIDNFAAEAERENARRRTRDAMLQKAKLGHAVAGKTFGYTLVRQGDHTEREINPDQASVVRRVFEMSAEGQGDLRIVNTLKAESVPAPGPKGWCKNVVRGMLRNELYVGVAIYGRTRVVDQGGRVGKKVAAPAADWIRVEVPSCRIVSDDLWRKVQARKAQTRRHYRRAPDGQRLGKPEAGLVATHLLNGFLRCHECGGAMTGMSKGAAKRHRYYCATRLRRGTCANHRGVPAHVLDSAVQAALNEKLDEDAIWELCQERTARLKRERAGKGSERANAEREAKRLEAVVARLLDNLESGQAVADRLKQRQAELDALRAKLTASPVLDLNRETLHDGLVTVRTYLGGSYRLIDDPSKDHILVEDDRATGPIVLGPPVQVRQALRKVGVERIVVKPDGDGWSFEGLADLGPLVNKGHLASPRRPPPVPRAGDWPELVAPAEPALEPRQGERCPCRHLPPVTSSADWPGPGAPAEPAIDEEEGGRWFSRRRASA